MGNRELIYIFVKEINHKTVIKHGGAEKIFEKDLAQTLSFREGFFVY